MNDPKSKRIISVRTPVVLYEKSQITEPFYPEKCVANFNEKIKKSPPATHKKSQSTPEAQKPFFTRNSKSMGPSLQSRKTCGQILMNEQNFIVLKSNKFQQESGSLFKEKRKSYREILNKISTRIQKLKSDEKFKPRSFDYDPEDNMQIFRLNPAYSPAVPLTRKRLLAHGGKRYINYT